MEARKKKKAKKEARINLNKKFYDEGTVRESLKDFKNICETSLKVHDNYLEVVMIDKGNAPENMGLEFSNYVIASMKNKLLV